MVAQTTEGGSRGVRGREIFESAGDGIAYQINLLKSVLDRVPLRAEPVGRPEPVGEDQHEGQQQTEQERDPSFQRAVLSFGNWMPHSEN